MTNIQKLLISACLITAACTNEKEAPVKIESYEVISPIVKDIFYHDEYVAEIQSVKYAEIRSKIKGYVEKIHVDEGQIVKDGQLLFTLSALGLEKEIQKADAAYKSDVANLKAAQVELDSVRTLVEKNIVSKTKFDVLQAKVDALKADMQETLAGKEQAVLQHSFASIKAPYNGIINRIPNKVGSLISEGDMLTSISDSHEVFAYFNFSEVDYLNYISTANKEATVVDLQLANHTLYPHQGKIEMIESEFDHQTGNIALRAKFPNPNGILKQGSNGKIILKKSLKNALLIPQKSTFEIQDKIYVFVVDKDGVLKQRNILSKKRISDFYVVDSGISKDEKIVFEGVANVKDGEKIIAVPRDVEKEMPIDEKDL
ncbi:MAG: efflux RND transporter periplasmic adaptor subunit [Methylococcales bacterium]|nr:efflux RND transporter periplasmic adaptor subunit [Methylococcales bacterium]